MVSSLPICPAAPMTNIFFEFIFTVLLRKDIHLSKEVNTNVLKIGTLYPPLLKPLFCRGVCLTLFFKIRIKSTQKDFSDREKPRK